MIKYKCPKCGATLESPSSLAGQNDQCPLCKHTCTVPERKTRRAVIVGSCAGGGLLLAIAIALVLAHGTKGSGKGTDGTTEARPATAKPLATHPVLPKEKAVPPVAEILGSPQPAPPANTQPIKPSPDAPLSPEQLFERASPAVVYIVVRDKDFKPIGLGSGFFVAANGLIVTNYHVIKGAEFATVRLSKGATLFVDGVTATDPKNDLALLTVSGTGYPLLKTADGPLPKVGSAVYAIGNPQGMENTFSGGMVSGLREIKAGFTAIQVTTPISPGSSGGPLLNAAGEVVGVTAASLTGGQNLNFAVPVAAVQRLIQRQGKVQTLASAGGGRLETAETEELDKAWLAIDKQDWKGASEILIRLRKSQPDNPVVWFALGYLHRRLGNDEIAIQHYKRAIVLKPDYADAYCWMGHSYFGLGLDLYTEAIAAYKQAIAVKPDYAEAYQWMGSAYRGLEKYSEAIEAYKKAIAIKPDDAYAYSSMGGAYWGLEKYSEAIEAYKKAIAIKPDDAYVYWLLGISYDSLKLYTEAIEAYKKAIALKPDNEEAYCMMGSSYEALGQRAAARAAYQQSLRLKSSGDFADLARKGIRRLGGQ